jgi:alpha-D-xyloside xylohydrolase
VAAEWRGGDSLASTAGSQAVKSVSLLGSDAKPEFQQRLDGLHVQLPAQPPAVMDWRTDPNTRDIGDEFMFGPAMLVRPVLQPDATRRTLYLPDSPAWYDFWTGASHKGGREIDADAPLDRIPLYVRAGSIIPLGPEIEYTSEKLGGPIELRIYTGADGTFDLHQDTGDSYDYEKGARSVIPLRWSESSKTLTIGDRKGEYPEMPASIQISIVWVSAGHGASAAPVANPDMTVEYTGKAISVKERRNRLLQEQSLDGD